MNLNTAPASVESAPKVEFVWQRLQEPFRLLGMEGPGLTWLVVLGVVLALALFYVGWMYIQDSRGVGIPWACLLGTLRLTVYALLAIVFLLPSNQHSTATETRSKVVVAIDVTGSMHVSDEPPSGPKAPPPTTRMDKVIEFLMSPDANFTGNLLRKNPITVYRFGTRLDDDYLYFADGKVWTRQQREAPANADGTRVVPEKTSLTRAEWKEWLNPAIEAQKPLPARSQGENEEDYKKRLEVVGSHKQKLRDLVRGTNLGDSLRTLLDREQKNHVQGIVVFSDGRNTEGSATAFRDVETKSKEYKMPIFVVAIGEERAVVKVDVRKLRAPAQARPEDTFRVQAELSGVGLADQTVEIWVDVTNTRKVKLKKEPKKLGESRKGEAKVEIKKDEDQKEEPLPIRLVEAKDDKNEKAKREIINLGNKLTLRPVDLKGKAVRTLREVKFRPGTPPLVEAEFYVDAATLAAAAGIDLKTDKRYAGKRPFELEESPDEDSALRFVARVPFHKKETRQFKDGAEITQHVSDQASTRIVKKQLRVLLFASAATRDFQFLQSLLVREMDKGRLDVAVHLQLPPGEVVIRKGLVQSVPPDKLLRTFPDVFEPHARLKDPMNLAAYDVLVCFDPDWKRLAPDQINAVVRWARTNKTGLVYLGGHFNTVKLASLPAEEEGTYRELLRLLPVELGDRRRYLTRKTDVPWDLEIEPSRELEFMRLDEASEGWKEFFFGAGTDATKEVQRGFFNFYPVKKVVLGSQVVARYKDPEVRLEQDGERKPHPFIVIRAFENEPRSIWIGSTETWRLREYKEEFHERFWTKLLQFAGGNSKGPSKKKVTVVIDDNVKANAPIAVEVNLDDAVGKALKPELRPKIKLEFPPGVPTTGFPKELMLQPRLNAEGEQRMDGWFSSDFRLRSEGRYVLTIEVPDLSDESGKSKGETITRVFFITPTDPEMDDTRPDYDRLYRLASEADDVFNRIGDRASDVKKRLTRPKLDTSSNRPVLREDKQRLYFELKNARYVPDCMMQEVQQRTSKGGLERLWDSGVVLWRRDPGKPMEVSYASLVVVGLLSIEWLIRKLLRLA